jgi:hypothetical protein
MGRNDRFLMVIVTGVDGGESGWIAVTRSPPRCTPGRRGATTFAIPVRPVWAAPDYATANMQHTFCHVVSMPFGTAPARFTLWPVVPRRDLARSPSIS